MAIVIFGKYIELWIDLFAVLSIITLYVIFLSKWIRKVILAFKLPGPKALPLIGNCLVVANNEGMMTLGKECYAKYGPLFRIWISFLPTFVILEPKDLQNILGNYKNTEKAFFYSLMHNFLGNGLITNSGATWKIHRKLLQPSFNINILETFIDTFWDSSNLVVDRINNAAMINPNINITSFINNSVLDILNEAILGITIKDNHWKGFYDNSPFRQGKLTAQERVMKPWLLSDFLYKLTNNGKDEKNQKLNIDSFTKGIIKNRKIERTKGISKRDRTNLLERLLDIQEENPSFTDEDIANEICTFMLAGQESVATIVAACLYFLAKHQNIQNNVLKEMKIIFFDSKRMPNNTDLNKMKYLQQCIEETLRLCPSVPLFARKIGEDIKIGKHILPSGSDVFISPYITHRLPYIYPNPEVFDPERFRLENIEKRHPFSFIPFSGGPRNCIGYKFAMMEMKTIISTILRNFELSVVPEYEMKMVFRVTLRAKGGIWLTVKPRL